MVTQAGDGLEYRFPSEFKLVCGFRLGNVSLIGEDGIEGARALALTLHDADGHDSTTDVPPGPNGAEFEMVFALPQHLAEALLDRLTRLMSKPATVVRE